MRAALGASRPSAQNGRFGFVPANGPSGEGTNHTCNMTSVRPGGARSGCSCHGGLPSKSDGRTLSLSAVTYPYAAPTSESLPPIFENISWLGSARLVWRPLVINRIDTQCSPIVGIHPNFGWNPAEAAEVLVPSEATALATVLFSRRSSHRWPCE